MVSRSTILLGGFVLACACAASFSRADDDSRAQADALQIRIEALSLARGPFSDALFEPLMALARLQIAYGAIDEARDSLRSAQNISHRNDGVYSLKQLEALRLLTNILLAEEEFNQANRQQKFAHFVQTHELERTDPGYLAAFRQLADWYINSGQPRRARRLLEDAMEIVRELDGDLLPWAIMMNRARRFEGLCCRPDALATAITESLDSDPDTQLNAYLALADSLIMARKLDEATSYYRLAAAITPTALSGPPVPISAHREIEAFQPGRVDYYRVDADRKRHYDRLRRLSHSERLEDESLDPQWFILDAEGQHLGFAIAERQETTGRRKTTQSLVGSPLVFNEEQLDNLLPFRWIKKKEELELELSFTVTETGDLQNIEVVESNVPVKLRKLIVSALRKVYYRPAFVAGEPVATDDVRLKQTFRRVQREI